MHARRCILITGATGFIGSYLARRLAHTDYDVHILVRTEPSSTFLNTFRDRLVIHRIGRETGTLANLLQKVQPTLVFHLAAYFVAEHGPDDLERLINSNILFSTQLFEAMAQTGSDAIVSVGTSWQHNQQDDYDPASLYAATKQAAEDLLVFYCNAKGIRNITLKLFESYGPHDPRQKLFNLLRAASHSVVPIKFSPGHQLLDLVYVEDIVDAFEIAGDLVLGVKRGSNASYGVSSGELVSLRSLVKTYEVVSGRHPNIEWGGRPYRAREVMRPWRPSHSLPGWSPRTDLVSGIHQTIAAEGPVE